MSSTSLAASLHKAEFRITAALSSIFALRMFGLFLLLPVFSLYGDRLEGSTPFLIGTAIGAYGLMQALLQIPFGMLSDRFGRRPLILVGLLFFVAGGAVAAISDHIYGVILGRALQGAGAIASVVMALVSDSVSDARRTRAMALIGMSVGGTFVMALILGPLMARSLGLSGLFWTTAAMGGLALVVTLLWVPASQAKHSRAAMRSPLSLAQLLVHPDLRRLNISIFSLHLVMTATFVVLPLVLKDAAGLAIASHSALYLGVMVGGVALMVPMIIYAERRAVRPAMVAGIILLLVAEVMLAMAPAQLWWYVVALLAFFTAFNLLEALLPSLVGRAVPVGTRGAAMGVYSTSQFMGVFIGGQLGGFMLGYSGASAAFWVSAGVLVVWGVIACSFRELRRLESRVVELTEVGPNADRWLEQVLTLDGVVEGLVVSQDYIAVLKLDPAIVDEERLKQTLVGVARVE